MFLPEWKSDQAVGAMNRALLWAAVFIITVLETLIATWEGRADRQATSSRSRKWSLRAAHWAAAFELVLFVDIMLLVKEGWTILVPILAGAWIGKYAAVERRRRKWWINNPLGRQRKREIGTKGTTKGTTT